MCGRFTLKTPPAQWSQLLLPIVDFQPLLAGWQPRYNIAPTQDILALACEAENAAYATYFRWGLLPKWATELSIGSRMINARRETLAEKKSFATPLATRRCLIIADGYYEWRPEKAGKQAYWISPKDGGIMQFAGLWEQNSKIGPQPIRSCTIITTAAAANLAAI
ncbi:MAG: SOS response-associated peptidase, partial [Planctomycetales bacterium]|nr:SOS response-associated peptidase [Planctomycetales bacterium]